MSTKKELDVAERRRRRAISEGQKRRFAKLREEGLLDMVDRKQCSNPNCARAGQWLVVSVDAGESDFTLRKRRRPDGSTTFYPNGECKTCAAARAQAWRDNTPSSVKKRKYRQWNKARRSTPQRAEAENRYQREFARMQRRLNGDSRGGAGTRTGGRAELQDREAAGAPVVYVDAGPLRELLRGLRPLSEVDFPSETRTVYGLLSAKPPKRVTFTTADRILVAYDMADQARVLWPNL